MKKPLFVYLLIALVFFQAVSAILGGLALMLFPRGEHFDMPLSLLRHTPFDDFFIPGFILFISLGVLPFAAALGMIMKWDVPAFELINYYRRRHWSWTFSYYTGIMLIIWIDVQVMMIREVDPLHLVYSLLGLAIIMVAHLPAVTDYYVKND